jgi:hypothetical protein
MDILLPDREGIRAEAMGMKNTNSFTKKLSSVFKAKKFKYGSAAVGLTAAVLAVVILLNIGFTFLASNLNWYADMTRERLYTLSDASDALLLTEPDDGARVRIIFLSTPDELQSSDRAYQVYTLSREYESRYSYVEIEHLDPITDRSKLTYFTENDSSVSLDAASVVFVRITGEGAAERYGIYKILSLTSFFIQDTSSSYEGLYFIGEEEFTSAIYSLSFAGDRKSVV